jgi:hypothetical protein
MWKGAILLCWTPWKELVAVPGLRLAPKHWTVTIYHRQKSTQLMMSVFTETHKTKLYSFLCCPFRAFLCRSITSIFNFFYHCATDPSGPKAPHFRGFMMTLRHAALGRTPLDE